jgi:hypothetical protein
MDAAGGVAYGAVAFVYVAAEVVRSPYAVVVWMLHEVDLRVVHVVIYDSCISGFAELLELVIK